MSVKPVFRRRLARRDTEEATVYYAREAGLAVATRFVSSLRIAYRAISERPGTGSPRYADRLNIRGLRSRPVAGFPFLIFYKEQEDRIEILRVLHSRRDIPGMLQETGR